MDTIASDFSAPSVPVLAQERANLNLLDPRLVKEDSIFDASWPNYCYQSDASGSHYVIWAKTEAESNAGIHSFFSSDTTAPSGFAVPKQYLPNALYIYY